MKARYIIAFVVIISSCIACQKNELENGYAESDCIVKFVPNVSESCVPLKGTLDNESGTDKSLGKYVDEFMVAAWSSAKTQIIPDERAKDFGTTYVIGGYQKVMRRTSSDGSEYWMTIQPQKVSGASTYADYEYIWKKDEIKTFYAYANLPATGATVENADASGQTLIYTVPATAPAQMDILIGSYQGDGKSGSSAEMTGTASIKFEHPLTAVRFIRGEMDSECAIIKLEGLAKDGQVTMNDTHVLEEWTGISDYSLTATLTNGAELVEGDPIGDPFVVIPQDLAEHNIAVTVKLANGMSGTVELKEGKWKAGEINVYTINYIFNKLLLSPITVEDFSNQNVIVNW